MRSRQTALRPLINWITTEIKASTRRMWMNPPTVYEDTIPKNHIKTKITAIVQSMGFFLLFESTSDYERKHVGVLSETAQNPICTDGW